MIQKFKKQNISGSWDLLSKTFFKLDEAFKVDVNMLLQCISCDTAGRVEPFQNHRTRLIEVLTRSRPTPLNLQD